MYFYSNSNTTLVTVQQSGQAPGDLPGRFKYNTCYYSTESSKYYSL